jgi:predicted heme/steroid binding protein
MVTIFNTEAEVAEYYKQDKENHKVVLFEGVVYDVKLYMPQHPGGEAYLADNLGKNIEEEFEEAEHTKSARRLFNSLPVVGYMAGSEPADLKAEAKGQSQTATSDLKQKKFGFSSLYGDDTIDDSFNAKLEFDYNNGNGIVDQIFYRDLTFDEYNKYINEPKHLINPVRDLRMFSWRWIEALSKTPWWAIPIAYIPLCTWWISNFSAGIAFNIFFTCIGIIGWGLAEYVLHRFVFHGEDTWM